jgi:hypothetical protein
MVGYLQPAIKIQTRSVLVGPLGRRHVRQQRTPSARLVKISHFPPFKCCITPEEERLTMDNYLAMQDSIRELILVWADPENKFRGYTEVRNSI